MEQVKDLQNIFNGFVEKFSEGETVKDSNKGMNEDLKHLKSIVNITDEAFNILYDNYSNGRQLEVDDKTYWEAVYKHVTQEQFEDKILYFHDVNEENYFKETVKKVKDLAQSFEDLYEEDESLEVNSIRQSLHVLNDIYNIDIVSKAEYQANVKTNEKSKSNTIHQNINGITISIEE